MTPTSMYRHHYKACGKWQSHSGKLGIPRGHSYPSPTSTTRNNLRLQGPMLLRPGPGSHICAGRTALCTEHKWRGIGGRELSWEEASLLGHWLYYMHELRQYSAPHHARHHLYSALLHTLRQDTQEQNKTSDQTRTEIPHRVGARTQGLSRSQESSWLPQPRYMRGRKLISLPTLFLLQSNPTPTQYLIMIYGRVYDELHKHRRQWRELGS